MSSLADHREPTFFTMLRFATLPLVLLLLAAGCRTVQPFSNEYGGTAGPMTIAGFAELDERFTLVQGASTVVDGMTVRFDYITEDSRCPANVDCVWEGRATVSLSLIAGDTMQGVQLSIPGFVGADSAPRDIQTAEAMGVLVTLLQLDPYPGMDDVNGEMTPMVTLVMTRAE